MPAGPHYQQLVARLREIDVEVRPWPGRDDGFASVHFGGEEFAHFHCFDEIDIRLGKDVIQRERLSHRADSTVHPKRGKGSPWYEMKIRSAADVDAALRLMQIAIRGL